MVERINVTAADSLFPTMNRFPTIVYGLVILDFQRLFNPQTTYFIPKCLEVPEVDKSLHPWQQATGCAVWQWIEPLTDPGELMLEPAWRRPRQS